MSFVHSLQLRLRCAWRTRGLHELDVHAGRCRHCKLPWAKLYPHDRYAAPDLGKGKTGETSSRESRDQEQRDSPLAAPDAPHGEGSEPAGDYQLFSRNA